MHAEMQLTAPQPPLYERGPAYAISLVGSQGLCKSSLPERSRFHCVWERKSVCSKSDGATRNACRPLEAIRSHGNEDAGSAPPASYRDLFFLVAASGGGDGVLPV